MIGPNSDRRKWCARLCLRPRLRARVCVCLRACVLVRAPQSLKSGAVFTRTRQRVRVCVRLCLLCARAPCAHVRRSGAHLRAPLRLLAPRLCAPDSADAAAARSVSVSDYVSVLSAIVGATVAG